MQVESPQGTNTEQEFYILGKRCSLKSSCSIFPQSSQMMKKSEILNFASIGNGNFIKKSFKLILSNKIICFEDTIIIEQPEFKSSEENPSVKQEQQPILQQNPENCKAKKLVLFKDNAFNSFGKDKSKNDKKNIVKNVVNAFMKYIKTLIEKGRDLQQQLDSLNALIKEKKFNNQLISGLIEKQNLRECFKLFLSIEAANWLQKSKIKDKETYREAFKVYERLCDKDSGSEDGPGSNNEKPSPNQPGYSSSNNSIYGFRQLGNNDLEDELLKFK